MSFPGAATSSGNPEATGWAFNPPPDWPAPPPGWQPPQGWQPDPAWPPAPDGWNFWVPAPGDAPGGTEVRLSLGGQAFSVRPGQEARIGRAPENDIVVNDPTVSRQHAVIRSGPDGWEYAKVGSAPTYLNGQEITRIAVDQALDLALGSLEGPTLRLEPVRVPVSQSGPPPATMLDVGARPAGPLAGAAAGAPAGRVPDPGAPYASRQTAGDWGAQPGWGAPPGWGGRQQPASASGSGDELATALRILFPVQSWLHNSGWRQGLRLGVIVYALLPLIFLTVLSSSSDLSTPGWAYSLYVAPLWAVGFWMLIRPPEHIRKLEVLIGGAIVVWALIWINVVTINVNDALPTKNGIGVGSAIVIGINEEITKALPILLAGLILFKVRGVKLDVRMWMFLGTIAGLTFGVAEQAFYTSNDIVLINVAKSPSEAVTAILAFAERVFVDGFQHAVWAGISGFFIGLALNYRRRRVQLIVIGIGTSALLHALNDWLAGTSPWLVIIVQAASLLLFLGYTMSAASIEQQVRETPIFRGQSMIMEAFKFPGQAPPR